MICIPSCQESHLEVISIVALIVISVVVIVISINFMKGYFK